jgi:hypothetical protein
VERVRERGFEREAVALIAAAFRGGPRVVRRGPGAILSTSVAPGSDPRLDPFGFSPMVDAGTDPPSTVPDQPTTRVTLSPRNREVAGRRTVLTDLEVHPDPEAVSSQGCPSGDEVEPTPASARAKGAEGQPTWSPCQAAASPTPAEVPVRIDGSRATGGQAKSARDLVRSRSGPSAGHRVAGLGDGPTVGEFAHRPTSLRETTPRPFVQRPDDRRTDAAVATVSPWRPQALLGRTPPSGGWPGGSQGLDVRVTGAVGLGAGAPREGRDGGFAGRTVAPPVSAGGPGVSATSNQLNIYNNSEIEGGGADVEGPEAPIGRLFEPVDRGERGLFPSGMRSVYPLR